MSEHPAGPVHMASRATSFGAVNPHTLCGLALHENPHPLYNPYGSTRPNGEPNTSCSKCLESLAREVEVALTPPAPVESGRGADLGGVNISDALKKVYDNVSDAFLDEPVRFPRPR